MPDEVKSKNIEAVKRELERRSQDTIIVFNPTKEPRKVVWNRFIHVVQPMSEAVLPRYIAEKYVRETVNFLIMEKNAERVKRENERRLRAGLKIMDAQEREVFDWRANNTELRKQYIPMVYKGIAEEYGKYDETQPVLAQAPIIKGDEDIIEMLDKENAQKVVEQRQDVETTEDIEIETLKNQTIAKVAE